MSTFVTSTLYIGADWIGVVNLLLNFNSLDSVLLSASKYVTPTLLIPTVLPSPAKPFIPLPVINLSFETVYS